MKELIMKILFVLGIIVILIMIVFGIMRIVPKVIGSLATAGSALTNATFNRESIDVTTNSDELTSGEPFVLSWEHINPKDDNGLYAFSYACEADVSFKIIGKNDAAKSIICNTPFTLSDVPINIQLIPTLTQKDSLRDVELTISYTQEDANAPRVRGEKTVTIRNFGDDNSGNLADVGVVIETDYDSIGDSDDSGSSQNNQSSGSNNNSNSSGSGTPTTGGSGQVYNPPVYRGPADLAISNVRATGSIVQFTVSNVGGTSTGVWTFNYTLPTSPTETRSSGYQISLNPGESLGFTLRISDDGSLTGNLVTIQLNPYGYTSEASTANNFGSTTISYTHTGGGNGGYNPNDDADLVIEDLEVGYLSGNRFIEDDTIDEDDDAAVRFTVRNKGGKYTGSWRFQVDLPTEDNTYYRSGNQSSLAPGASITYTLEFDNLDKGNNQDIKVEVDIDDDVDEESENNNRRSVEVDIR